MCLPKAKGKQMTKPHLYISRTHVCVFAEKKKCIEGLRVARQHMASPYCCHSLGHGSARSLLAGSGFTVSLRSGCCAVIRLLCSVLQ